MSRLDLMELLAGKEGPKHLKGVRCDVTGCAYHDGDNRCTADSIAIGPQSATTCRDTVCATFKPKER